MFPPATWRAWWLALPQLCTDTCLRPGVHHTALLCGCTYTYRITSLYILQGSTTKPDHKPIRTQGSTRKPDHKPIRTQGSTTKPDHKAVLSTRPYISQGYHKALMHKAPMRRRTPAKTYGMKKNHHLAAVWFLRFASSSTIMVMDSWVWLLA